MQKWEYARVSVMLGEGKGTYNVDERCVDKYADVTLTLLGREGWELVSTVSRNDPATYTLFFKRPAQN